MNLSPILILMIASTWAFAVFNFLMLLDLQGKL